jgi:hypothetical protein
MKIPAATARLQKKLKTAFKGADFPCGTRSNDERGA